MGRGVGARGAKLQGRADPVVTRHLHLLPRSVLPQSNPSNPRVKSHRCNIADSSHAGDTRSPSWRSLSLLPQPFLIWCAAPHLADERYILASDESNATVAVWSVFTGELVQRFEGHKRHISALAHSPTQSAFVTTSDDGQLRVWSAGT